MLAGVHQREEAQEHTEVAPRPEGLWVAPSQETEITEPAEVRAVFPTTEALEPIVLMAPRLLPEVVECTEAALPGAVLTEVAMPPEVPPDTERKDEVHVAISLLEGPFHVQVITEGPQAALEALALTEAVRQAEAQEAATEVLVVPEVPAAIGAVDHLEAVIEVPVVVVGLQVLHDHLAEGEEVVEDTKSKSVYCIN